MVSKFYDLKNRFLSSTVIVIFLTIFIYFSQLAFMKILSMVFVACIGVTAIWEYVEFLKTKKIILPFKLLALFTALLIFSNYFQVINVNINGINQIMLGLFFFAIFLYNFSKVEEAIVHIATSFFGIVYILVPLSLMVRILYPDNLCELPINGRLWLAYLIIVTKITDIGGYFVGTLWGKSKLAPHLSPGKTLAGAIGGFCFAIFASFLFFLISYFISDINFHLSFIHCIVLGGTVGIFGQIGDLAESLLKRDAKVKDSNSIPGFSGVLDNLDSLLFTAPIVYMFLKICRGL
jgi:phosphatidate cytidylyltransferase